MGTKKTFSPVSSHTLDRGPNKLTPTIYWWLRVQLHCQSKKPALKSLILTTKEYLMHKEKKKKKKVNRNNQNHHNTLPTVSFPRTLSNVTTKEFGTENATSPAWMNKEECHKPVQSTLFLVYCTVIPYITKVSRASYKCKTKTINKLFT